jgi:hypothetical protein
MADPEMQKIVATGRSIHPITLLQKAVASMEEIDSRFTSPNVDFVLMNEVLACLSLLNIFY